MTEVTLPSQNGGELRVDLRRRILDFEDILRDHGGEDGAKQIPVTQYFSRGVYVREITIPAGTILTGHIHRYACMSVVLTGKMEVVTEEGPKIVEAPLVFESPAGVKRAGRCLEDCRWLTIHPYNGPELSPDDMLPFHHVDDFEELELATSDREDYHQVLEAEGVDDALIREMSERDEDYRQIPELGMWRVGPSRIEGLGVFALVPYPRGATIGAARVGRNRTQLGRFVNHAAKPNAQHIFHPHADMVIQIALEDIRPGDEITNDYRRSFNMHRQLQETQT